MGIFDSGDSTKEGNAHDTLRATDSVLLHDAVMSCVAQGWLVSFGRSRDGYAVSCTVINGGAKERVWCEDVESLQKALEALVGAATPLGGASTVTDLPKASGRKWAKA